MKLAADEMRTRSNLAMSVQADPMNESGLPHSFPSDVAHQLGLASAMLSMQGYAPEMLMHEQRRMSTLLKDSALSQAGAVELATQADILLASGDLAGAEVLLAKAEAAQKADRQVAIDEAAEDESLWQPADSGGSRTDSDAISPDSGYCSPVNYEDMRGFSDDSDIEAAPEIPHWRPSVAGRSPS
jgi:hypothetical protein